MVDEHEHDFAPTSLAGNNGDSNYYYVKCLTCGAIYCNLCGGRLAGEDSATRHGPGRCV